MGLFNFFTNSYEEKPKKNKREEGRINLGKKQNMGADTFKPNSFQDLYGLIDVLKIGRPVIVDCSMLKESTGVRVLDILSGATYALNGDWKPISQEIFMFVPNGAPENGKF